MSLFNCFTEGLGYLLVYRCLEYAYRRTANYHLVVGHLEKMQQEVYKITVYKNHKEEYITFCSPECVKAIDDYLAYRERYGEKLKSFSPLIREQFDKTDAEAAANPKSVGVKTRSEERRVG